MPRITSIAKDGKPAIVDLKTDPLLIIMKCPYCHMDYGPQGQPRHKPDCALLLDQLKMAGKDPQKWIAEHTHPVEE